MTIKDRDHIKLLSGITKYESNKLSLLEPPCRNHNQQLTKNGQFQHDIG